jgi:hypothetical protein
MSQIRSFDYDCLNGLFNRLSDLGIDTSFNAVGDEKVRHLKPLVDASRRSNNRMGRLTDQDVTKMENLGRCTHNKLLVLLLEPTKESNSTIDWIDSFLMSASRGSFSAANTAIINCRALLPNASYRKNYTDNSA